jgi:hypothetical protein
VPHESVSRHAARCGGRSPVVRHFFLADRRRRVRRRNLPQRGGAASRAARLLAHLQRLVAAPAPRLPDLRPSPGRPRRGSLTRTRRYDTLVSERLGPLHGTRWGGGELVEDVPAATYRPGNARGDFRPMPDHLEPSPSPVLFSSMRPVLASIAFIAFVAVPSALLVALPATQQGTPIQCGKDGSQTFLASIDPQVGVGVSTASQAEARAIAEAAAVARVRVAVAANLLEQGYPQADCDKDAECPAPVEGCEPGARLTNASGAIVVTRDLPTRTIAGVTIYYAVCTITIPQDTPAVDGCGPCPEVEA